MLSRVRFPTTKTLEGFDFAARPSVNKRLVVELTRCEYIDQRENVLLVGNPGTGKSHLASPTPSNASPTVHPHSSRSCPPSGSSSPAHSA
jgi:DNA replication protein DnaC